MLEQYFYKNEIRNITVALLDMFNSIKCYRYDSSGNVVKVIDVPVKFGPAEKYYLFQVQRESGKKYYPSFPSILVELTGITYDADRATGVTELRQFYDQALLSAHDQFWSDVQPAPYTFSFTVQVKTESMSDNSQILENILPAFNPSLHLRVKEFSFLNIERNMKVQLGDVSYDYPQEMSEEDSRYINSTMTFTVDGYMYRPVSQSHIIKYIKTNYWYNNDAINKERYSTSGMDVSATPPSDYTYGELLGDDKIKYTKVGE